MLEQARINEEQIRQREEEMRQYGRITSCPGGMVRKEKEMQKQLSESRLDYQKYH